MSAYPTPQSCVSDDKPPSEKTSQKLERLSSAVVTAINARDFDFTSETAQELVMHISPDFRAELDTLPNANRPRTWEEQKLAWKKRVDSYPDVIFTISRMDSLVDEKKGRATVYMDMEVTGVGEGVVIHAMNQLEWKRVENEWRCHHVIGLRGTGGNTGGVG